MTAAPARRLATNEDLLALPEGQRAEVLGGALWSAPAPLPEHGRTQGALWRRIGGRFDDDHDRGGPGGWWILMEVDVRFGPHDIVRPDVAGWRRQRLPEPWGMRPIEVVPDWVCEVLSPSTVALDRGPKMDLYGCGGVAHLWFVDPVARTLEALRAPTAAAARLGVGAARSLGRAGRGEDSALRRHRPPGRQLAVAALHGCPGSEPRGVADRLSACPHRGEAGGSLACRLLPTRSAHPGRAFRERAALL